MKWFRHLFGLCEHRWEIIEKIDVFVTWDGENYPGQRPDHHKLTLQCLKCGDVKVKKI